jgi:hypothetical protein
MRTTVCRLPATIDVINMGRLGHAAVPVDPARYVRWLDQALT